MGIREPACRGKQRYRHECLTIFSTWAPPNPIPTNGTPVPDVSLATRRKLGSGVHVRAGADDYSRETPVTSEVMSPWPVVR